MIPFIHKSTKIFFPTDFTKVKSSANTEHKIRFVRSTDNDSLKGQKQRDALIKRIFANVRSDAPTTNTKILEKIVNSDEYIDPYWNIKNSNFKTNKPTNVKIYEYDYDTVESDEKYTEEIPKPGLFSSYFGQPSKPLDLSWTNYNKHSEEEHDTHTSYGGNYYNTHTTFNPRISK